MTPSQINRLVATLGKDPVRKYFVYKLLDHNNKPFYVGKGEGTRPFAHLKEADKIKRLIEENEKINSKAESEANVVKSDIDISDKIDRILNENSNGKDIEIVIVKWGLTESEAFMCESTLINALEFLNFSLANKVNGHASKPEKNTHPLDGVLTKARTLDDFLTNVAIPSVNFKSKGIMSPTMFIKINDSYDAWLKDPNLRNKISKDDYIYECARGFWKIDDNKRNKIEFVVVLYHNIVLAVYAVDKNKWFAMGVNNKSLPYNWTLTYPTKYRPNDAAVRNSGINNESSNKVGFTKHNSIPSNLQADYNALNGLADQLLEDQHLNKKGLISSRYYNFDVDKNGNVVPNAKWK